VPHFLTLRFAQPQRARAINWFGVGGQLIFERGSASRSDPDAASFDRLAVGLADRALCCRQPGVHKVGQRPACEAVGKHNRFGGAEWNTGEQLKGAALFGADATFSRRCRHR
jgi:hypothetical protein